MLHSSVFRLAFGNTLKFLVVALPLIILLSYAIALLLKRQEQAYSAQEAYDFFAESMENALKAAYSGETEAAPASEGEKTELTILRTIIHTVASKCFLESCFAALRESESGGDGECTR